MFLSSCEHGQNLTPFFYFIDFIDTEAILHAFITLRLNKWNSLFMCLNRKTVERLQTSQKSAARLEHMTPVLASLYWLPVYFRIYFKDLLIN